jgi:hypothetical protein
MLNNIGSLKLPPSISTKKVIALGIILLLIAHLTIRAYVPTLLINFGSIFFIGIIIFFYTIKKLDIFYFIMLIYLSSYFLFGAAQGGSFNYVAFLVVSISIFVGKKMFEVKNIDLPITFLIFVLIVNNAIGWMFKNPGSMMEIVQGIICFIAYIFLFNLSRHILLTPLRIKTFIQINIFIMVYNVIFNINNMIGYIKINSPIVSTVEKMFGNLRGASGTIGSSAILGENALMLLILFVPLLLSSYTRGIINIKKSILTLGIIAAILNIVFSGSRSILILTIIFLFVLFVSNQLNLIKSLNKKSNYFSFLFLILISLIIVYYFVDVEYLLYRLTFSDIGDTKINLQTIIEGGAVHRDWAFEVGRENIDRESWWVGYGWSVPEISRMAWFKNVDINRTSPHSIYFAAVPLFGWVGTFAFIGIFIVTTWRLFRIIIKFRNKGSVLILLSFSFTLIFIFQLINGYKADFIYLPHYVMAVWIWLGLANNIYYNLKKQTYTF